MEEWLIGIPPEQTVLKSHRGFYISENFSACSYKERIDVYGKRKDKDC